MTENLDAYLSDFAVSATLPSTAVVRGIFDNGALSGGALGIIGTTSPTFIGKTSDLSGVTVGSSVTVNSVAFTVAEIEPDGTGMAMLRLK